MSVDHGKFLEILEQHKGILFKISNSYSKEKEDRQDLVQEMTLQIYRSFDRYDPQYQWSTFIYRIALNVAISFYRKQKRNTHNTSLSESILQIPDISHLENADPEELSLLNGFINNLKPLDKALMLLYLDETSTTQMSEILGITETNVTSKIHRIKNKLKVLFENY